MNTLFGFHFFPKYLIFLFWIQELYAVKEYSIRLNGTSRSDTGRVEIFRSSQWWTICGYDWDILDAFVVCQTLGFKSAANAYTNRTSSNWPGPDSMGILMSNVTCTGYEQNILQCDRSEYPLVDQSCDHSMDAGVACSMEAVRLPSVIVSRIFTAATTTLATTTSTPEFSVRLVGGMSPMEGRVEVFIGGQWGTICDDGWHYTEADVICRQLGYTYATLAPTGAQFGEGTGPIHMRHVDCPDTATTIQECKSESPQKHCFHVEDAGAICSDARTPVDFDIRFIGSLHSYIGYVQVYYHGTWGYICNNGWNWDMRGADVACKEMGYERAFSEHATLETPKEPHFPYVISNIVCKGSEPSLRACRLIRGDSCYGNPASVLCSEVKQPGGGSTFSVRLRGGTNSSGRVEVYIGGAWGTVCDDGWDLLDAFVVCRQLGFYYALSAPRSAYFGEGQGRIELDDVECTGLEEYLVLCNHPGVGYHKCKHYEDAGVVCSNVPAPPIGSHIRIVFGGHKENQGRVEVHHNNLWWRVCNFNWDDNDAAVVCRQAHFRYGIALPVPPQYNEDEDSTVAAYIDNVYCYGTEASLADCLIQTVEPLECPFYRDAAVYCSNDREDINAAKTLKTDLPIRLSGGTSRYEGRVEVYSDLRWWSVCSEQQMQPVHSSSQVHLWPNTEAATVVCRQLEFDKALEDAMVEHLLDGADPRNLNFLLSEVRCNGTEESLTQCQHNTLSYPHKCIPMDRYVPATVKCSGSLIWPTTTSPDGIPDNTIILWLTTWLLSSVIILGVSICVGLVCRSRQRRTPEWRTGIIWHRPFCRRSGAEITLNNYSAVSVDEPWAPGAGRTLSEQEREGRQWGLTLALQRQTVPREGPPQPPPSYLNVVQNPENFPVPGGTSGGSHTQDMSSEEAPPPTYRKAIIEYPEVRQEFLSRTMNNATTTSSL